MWTTLIKDSIVEFFFPNLCAGCGLSDSHPEHVLCEECNQTAFTFHPEFQNTWNPLQTKFVGFPINVETYYFHFFLDIESPLITYIKKMKYRKRKDLAVLAGMLMGSHIVRHKLLQDIDVIVPVPLHPKKNQIRGYNQSELMAHGIAKQVDIAVENAVLVRTKNTPSQTTLSRDQRIKNMRGAFKVRSAPHWEYKHILLVDDVVTTGATIGECARILQDRYKCKISIGCFALPVN